HRAGGCAVPPLEIGLQAIQPWPYRAGLAAPRPGRLQTAAASLACSCPRQVSPPGKPGDPGTSPPSSSLLSRGYDEAPHGAHPACASQRTGRSPCLSRWSAAGRGGRFGPRGRDVAAAITVTSHSDAGCARAGDPIAGEPPPLVAEATAELFHPGPVPALVLGAYPAHQPAPG